MAVLDMSTSPTRPDILVAWPPSFSYVAADDAQSIKHNVAAIIAALDDKINTLKG